MREIVSRIQRDICREFGVTLCDLTSDRQGGGICRPRHEAMRRARAEGASYRLIGYAFRRNHTSVLQALKRMASA